jgi:hypothetical protein
MPDVASREQTISAMPSAPQTKNATSLRETAFGSINLIFYWRMDWM